MNELFFPPDIIFTVQDHQHISIVAKNLLDVKGKIRIKRIADVADNQRNDALSALAQTSGYCIWLITYLLHKIQHLFAQLLPDPRRVIHGSGNSGTRYPQHLGHVGNGILIFFLDTHSLTSLSALK